MARTRARGTGVPARPGPVPGADRDRRQLQALRLGHALEAVVGQRIHRHHVARPQQGGRGDGQPCWAPQTISTRSAGARSPCVARCAPRRRVHGAGRRAADSAAARPGRRTAPAGARRAQLLGLARQRRVVEAQVGHAGGGSLRVRAQEGRPFRFAHEGTAAGLADQAHGFQFRVHTRGRDQGQPLAGGELSVVGRRVRGQAPFADIGGVGVNQLL